jgi:hypothetical protein
MKTSKESTIDLVWHSISRLDSWLSENGWAGYDPYDLKGTSLYLGLIQKGAEISGPARVLRKALVLFEDRFPLLARRMLGVKKQINPKGMGLLARGYLDLYQATGQESFKEKALACLDWLERNPSSGFGGMCWGYPFDWQSVVFIPRGTPSAVVSSVVGDAFWRAYEVLGDQRYLDVCESICRFFTQDLNVDQIDQGVVCFSYTPLDDFHVHNANLFVAEFLIRIGAKLDQERYLELGQRAAAYALREQNPDGSLYYWGRVQNHHSPDHIDHYHCGFEIRSLSKIWKWTGDTSYRQAAEDYYHFYLQNLILETGGSTRPKMKPDSLYPIDIHSCAEALLCNATLATDFEVPRDLLGSLSSWILPNMQTRAGWFIYRILGGEQAQRRVEIPYLRWGQAWMLTGLASYYLLLTGE